ncbi:glycosyltransferase family 2 protein [Cellulomonas telluris]|uniref:glycosyltransferase family 2 protein n=1 Tax=Cellulomonas telluris TaxID=2306636 RepID=UPI0010A76D9A|nr:glycosyltransferase family 2 protein [Cellulomonas telluris]
MSDSSDPRVLVVLPAWNEAASLTGVLAEVRAHLPRVGILVVDDGSRDATADVARAAGVDVLQLPFNLGVGGAMRAGFRFARAEGYDAVVQVDADGQHDPADVPRLLAPLLAGEADVVLGARFAGVGAYSARGPRRWAMGLLSVVLSRIARTRLTDTTSGFRASNRRAIELFAREYPAEYLGDTVESLVIACRARLRVTQIGVEMRQRSAGVPSHGPFKAAVFLGRAVLALVVALSRPMVRTSGEATA